MHVFTSNFTSIFYLQSKLLMNTTVLRVRAHYNFKDNYFNYIGVSTKV